MKRIIQLAAVAAISLLAALPNAQAAVFDDSGGRGTGRAAWEAAVVAAGGSFQEVDETQWGTAYTTFLAGTPVNLPLSQGTLVFNQDLTGAQVGTDWETWSNPSGELQEFTPRVLTTLFSDNPDSVSAVPSGSLRAFGLEMEPNLQALFSMTLAGGETVTQVVNGNGGAAFFGWIVDVPVVGFTVSAAPDASGFAFGRMVVGSLPEPPPQGVPEGGSLALVSTLVFGGLLRFAKRGRTA
jgi:hypothetical protein